jgi:hypothetical protein
VSAAVCAWCSAPRVDGPVCPRCGANYAKAEQIKVQGRAAPAKVEVEEQPVAAVLVGMEDRAVEDPALEFRLCVAAIPAMLLLGVAFHFMTPGLQRIFFGMPVHELGHAVSAWFTGHAALPTLWKTFIAEERGWLAPLALAGALGYTMVRGYLAGKTYLVALGAALLVLQGLGTFYIKETTAQALFTFGGDGMGMVIATALMATFFFGKRTQLYKGWLRWGFLAIGAAAFSDMFATWWKALSDTGAIRFGEIEGVGLSDPARLVEEWGWSVRDMVRRFVGVGLACLAALALVYAWGVREAWRQARDRGQTPTAKSGSDPQT